MACLRVNITFYITEVSGIILESLIKLHNFERDASFVHMGELWRILMLHYEDGCRQYLVLRDFRFPPRCE